MLTNCTRHNIFRWLLNKTDKTRRPMRAPNRPGDQWELPKDQETNESSQKTRRPMRAPKRPGDQWELPKDQETNESSQKTRRPMRAPKRPKIIMGIQVKRLKWIEYQMLKVKFKNIGSRSHKTKTSELLTLWTLASPVFRHYNPSLPSNFRPFYKNKKFGKIKVILCLRMIIHYVITRNIELSLL